MMKKAVKFIDAKQDLDGSDDSKNPDYSNFE